MGKYIKYKRIEKIHSPETLQMVFDDLIKNDCEIIHYTEEKKDVDRIFVAIVYGKLNLDVKKQIL